jgi:hypothetical protein
MNLPQQRQQNSIQYIDAVTNEDANWDEKFWEPLEAYGSRSFCYGTKL